MKELKEKEKKKVLYFVAIILGVSLFSLQVFVTKNRLKNPDFVLWPSIKESIVREIREKNEGITKIYQEAKEEVGSSLELTEEDVKKMKEEGKITEEEFEEYLEYKKEVNENN
jgi:hypothetical protein